MFVPSVNAKDLVLNKKSGAYEVQVVIDSNPVIIGDNQIQIEIKDTTSGNYITDAEVMVNYYMPPMPRMAPMNYTTHAEPRGTKYQGTMHIIMAGPWIIKILITGTQKRVLAKFNVDAQ